MSTREPKRSILWSVVEKHLPVGWKLIEHEPVRDGKFKSAEDGKTLIYGEMYSDDKEIHCVKIVDRFTLCVFLHECAHARLQHNKLRNEDWVQQEYEAELYAISALRAEGLPVPRRYLTAAKDYVMTGVLDDHKKDIEVSDEVLKFVYGREWRKHR